VYNNLRDQVKCTYLLDKIYANRQFFKFLKHAKLKTPKID